MKEEGVFESSKVEDFMKTDGSRKREHRSIQSEKALNYAFPFCAQK